MNKGRFKNIDNVSPKGVFDLLKWIMKEKSTPWPKLVKNTHKVDLPTQIAFK
jgi:hypothetical protein